MALIMIKHQLTESGWIDLTGSFLFPTTDSIWRAETQKGGLLPSLGFGIFYRLSQSERIECTWNWLSGRYGQFRIKICNIKVENEVGVLMILITKVDAC